MIRHICFSWKVSNSIHTYMHILQKNKTLLIYRHILYTCRNSIHNKILLYVNKITCYVYRRPFYRRNSFPIKWIAILYTTNRCIGISQDTRAYAIPASIYIHTWLVTLCCVREYLRSKLSISLCL